MADISNISDQATERTNSAGVLTPILEYQPIDGVTTILKNAVEKGDQRLGFPVFAELYNTNGNLIDPKSRLAFGFEAANADSFEVVTVPFDQVRPYNTLDVKEQQNEEFIDRVKHKLKLPSGFDGNPAGAGFTVDHTDTLYVLLESPDQIDWSQGSRLQVYEDAVTEV